MRAYAYRAIHSGTGKIQKGKISAQNENELSRFLHDLDLELIEAKPEKPSAFSFSSLQKQMNKQSYHAELIVICTHMRDMLRAGVSFENAFTLCADSMDDPAFRDALRQITQDVRAGNYVSAAFEKQPHLFDPVFLSILEAGEVGGDLATTFDRLNKHLVWQDQVTRQIRKAVRYPLFLLCLALSVITFMLTFVLPQLIEFLSTLGHELPWSTRILIMSAEIFTQIWWLFPLLILGGIGTALTMRKWSRDSAVMLDHALLRIPLLGPTLHKLALVRLATSLSLLVKSGLPLPKALETAQKSLNSPALERATKAAHAQLLNGKSFSQAAKILFPPFVLQMLKVGEKSGTMPSTLDRVAKSIEDEAKDAVDKFLSLLEPALTVLVGALMAWIVLAILGPVYSSLAPLSQ